MATQIIDNLDVERQAGRAAAPTATSVERRAVSHLRLVRPASTFDAGTVSALEQLLAFARSGEINGIAFAFSRPGMKYMTDVTGFFAEHPTFARGALQTLADELAGLVHSRDEGEMR